MKKERQAKLKKALQDWKIAEKITNEVNSLHTIYNAKAKKELYRELLREYQEQYKEVTEDTEWSKKFKEIREQKEKEHIENIRKEMVM